jgi:hypothetical protein
MLEFDLNGVFVAGILVWAVIAYAIRMGLTRIFTRAGLYRLVWHRPLFDFALFVVLWGLVSALAFRLAYPHAELG